MALSASGPPASSKQIAYLASLLEKVGFSSFREARHPMGLNQRQAGGKFTVQEASEMIDRLLNNESASPDAAPDAASEKIRASQAAVLRGIPADLLSDELVRRGWSVHAPL